MTYQLVIYLDADQPIPEPGDLLQIVSMEDGNYNKFDIPYVTVTLKPITYSDVERKLYE